VDNEARESRPRLLSHAGLTRGTRCRTTCGHPEAVHYRITRRFQINWPNRGVIDDLPDDVVAEFRVLIDAAGVHPVKPHRLPRKIVLEQLLPFWLDMQRTLEAYRTEDRSLLLWNILELHQTRVTSRRRVEAYPARLKVNLKRWRAGSQRTCR
jgi:alpha-galactosidase/6-phospho-beta-glucosidase family protein